MVLRVRGSTGRLGKLTTCKEIVASVGAIQAIALTIYPAARLLPYFLRPNRRLISSFEKDSGAKSPSHAQTFS